MARMERRNWLKRKSGRATSDRASRQLAVESLESREVLAVFVWSPGVDLPFARQDAAAVLGADGAIYLLGGNTTDVDILSSSATSWETGEPIDKQRVAPGAGAVDDGRVFLFGGQNGGQAIEETYLYDPLGADPQDGAVMSIERARGAYATDPLSGLIYALGGVDADGVLLSTAEVYDPATDSWNSVTALPGGRADFAAAADGAGHIFAFGGSRAGYGSNDVSNSVYRYDIASNTWQAMAPMPAALRDVTAVAGPGNGQIYVIGGRNATGPVASVYAYSFVNNTWEVETSLPAAVADAAAVLDADGRVLVIGGRNSLGQAVTSVMATQDLDAVDSSPTFASTPITTATSTVAYSYQVIATGNPQPAFQLLAAPSGMTISPTGLISWMPGEIHVGTQSVTVRAFNRAGFVDQSYSVDVVSAFSTIISTPVTTGSTGVGYAYDVDATGAPPPSYALIESPAGMTIAADTGLISWTPTASQVGAFSVTVVAQNSLGSDVQSYSINVTDKIAPTMSASLAVAGVTTTSATLNWNPASDNVAVDHYRVYEQYKYGWRSSRTGYRLIQDNVPGNSTTVSGLVAGKTYKLAVTAVDTSGNESLRSNVVSVTALKPPTISYYSTATQNGAVVAVATHAMAPIGIYAAGVPLPTLSLVSGPAGLTFDPVTRLANWTPADDQVGTHTATFQATNSQGTATVTATITVNPNLPVISSSFSYFGIPHSTPFAVEGDPFDLQLRETYSNSAITWSLVSGPSGMNVDPVTGAVTWIPTAADVGTANVVFRGTNYAGSKDLALSFTVLPIGTDLQPPTPVSGITVSVIDYNRASVTWAPATDNVGVESYKITAYYTYQSRGTHTVRYTFAAAGDATFLEMTGLPGRALKLYIQAIDAAGNLSPVGQTVTFTPVANSTFPSISLASPLPTAVADQPLQIQLTDSNATPRTYSLLTAPAGATIDAMTGLIAWIPGYGDVGNSTFTVRATNAFGYRDLTINVPVYFTGSVQSVAYVRSGSGATVYWTPPVDASRVAGYLVYQQWSINGHTYHTTYNVTSPTATSLANLYIVGGPVVHKVTVTPYDALGNLGVSFPKVSLV